MKSGWGSSARGQSRSPATRHRLGSVELSPILAMEHRTVNGGQAKSRLCRGTDEFGCVQRWGFKVSLVEARQKNQGDEQSQNVLSLIALNSSHVYLYTRVFLANINTRLKK